MTLADPVGIIATRKERLKTTLAECNSVKDWSRERKTSIYFDVLPQPPRGRETFTAEEWQQLRPFILVYTEPITYQLDASPGGYHPRGSMIAVFEQNTPPGELTGEELDRLFDNFMGRVIAEILLKARNAQDGWIYPTQVTTAGPIRATHTEAATEGDWQQYSLKFDWGITA